MRVPNQREQPREMPSRPEPFPPRGWGLQRLERAPAGERGSHALKVYYPIPHPSRPMPSVWLDLLTPGVSLIEKVLRTVLVYFFLVVGLRLAGKRELAQLNPFDLVVLLTLSNTVQNAIIGNDNSVTGGVIGATTLLAVNWLVVRFL